MFCVIITEISAKNALPDFIISVTKMNNRYKKNIFKDTILTNFRKLCGGGLTVRGFLLLLFGFLLIVANIFLFVASLIYKITYRGFGISDIFFIGLGLLGLLVSCFLIFYLSLHVSANADTKKAREMGSGGGTILSDAFSYKGKGRAKRIAVAIIIVVVIFGIGIGALTYYFVDQSRSSRFVEIDAVIVNYISVDDDMYACVYRYTVDGTEYNVQGHLESSNAPAIGEKVTVRYDPNDPSRLYVQNEKIFFLGFGLFFIYAGLLIFIVEASMKGYISTQFLLAFIMLGLTAIIFTVSLTDYTPTGPINYLAGHFWMFFVFMFTNVGLLMLLEGILWFSLPKKRP